MKDSYLNSASHHDLPSSPEARGFGDSGMTSPITGGTCNAATERGESSTKGAV